MRLTYLGTATVLIELDGQRFLTDPAFDPQGTSYDFGPWFTPRSWFASSKDYTTPLGPTDLGALDAILLTHDHHADNLDYEGRKLMASDVVARTITTREAAARHGPHGTPRIHEVIGFLLEPSSAHEPVVWISGDTVTFPALVDALAEIARRPRKVDVAVMHAGAVNFPKLPILGKRLFTFDAAQLVEVARLVDPKALVPVHRDGWAHFRQPIAELRAALDAAGLTPRTRWLELGQTLELAT